MVAIQYIVIFYFLGVIIAFRIFYKINYRIYKGKFTLTLRNAIVITCISAGSWLAVVYLSVVYIVSFTDFLNKKI